MSVHATALDPEGFLTPGQDVDFAVVNASQLVQVGEGVAGPRRGAEQGELLVHADGALVAANGIIVGVGRTTDIIHDYDLSKAEVIDASGRLVMPGLVDAHTHPVFAGRRHDEYASRLGGVEMSDIKAQGGGTWTAVTRTRAATDAELSRILSSHLDSMLASGTTTVEAKSGYGLTPEQELRLLRIIRDVAASSVIRVIPTFLGAHLLPREQASVLSYVNEIVNVMLPQVKEQGIAQYCDTSCNEPFTPELATRILSAAARLGLPGRLHGDETKSQRGWITAVANSAASADHLTKTPDTEITEVGPTNTVAIMLPICELYNFWPRANARHFITTGVPIAIATDFSSSYHAPSLFNCMALAAPWYRMTPEEVISAVTVNAAYSLGVGKEVGSLDVGKHADLIVVDSESYRMMIHEFGLSLVQQVVVGGRIITLPGKTTSVAESNKR
jgi:imidazolonepropionase